MCIRRGSAPSNGLNGRRSQPRNPQTNVPMKLSPMQRLLNPAHSLAQPMAFLAQELRMLRHGRTPDSPARLSPWASGIAGLGILTLALACGESSNSEPAPEPTPVRLVLLTRARWDPSASITNSLNVPD